jgi:hypothetical protein
MGGATRIYGGVTTTQRRADSMGVIAVLLLAKARIAAGSAMTVRTPLPGGKSSYGVVRKCHDWRGGEGRRGEGSGGEGRGVEGGGVEGKGGEGSGTLCLISPCLSFIRNHY